MVNKEQLVLKTLLYFDIFDYPLTKEEIWQFLETKINLQVFNNSLKNSHLESYKAFFFLKGRKSIVKQRLEKEKISDLKISIAKTIARKLSIIPSVKFIGISGNLCMKNSYKEDDIDFFVISSKNLVWLTRFLCVIYLSFLKVYRNKKDLSVKNKICLNLIIGSGNLVFPKKRQNLYLAHEIVQLFPIFDRDGIYKYFIENNNWIDKYLPYYLKRINSYNIAFVKRSSLIDRIFIKAFAVLNLERLIRFLQWQYMKNDVTVEKISDNLLAFHPIDYEVKTLNVLYKKLNFFIK